MKKLLFTLIFTMFCGFMFAQNSFIVITKEDMTLRRYDFKGNVLDTYGIACGSNFGNKTMRGDRKTPEGVFHITQLLNARGLQHDFKDGKGMIKNAYGPYFFRLSVPGYNDIGIHGTHLPESIGSRCTEGCIRMKNEDILELYKHVSLSMVVIIIPSKQDACADNQNN